MSRTFFDNNHNLQIGGDVNVFSFSSGDRNDNHDVIHATRQLHARNAQAQILRQGLKILCDNTAPSARYESDHAFTGPQCHPGTRIAVQDYIVRWLDDEDGPIAMWMNGPVGIGKSAIARTVADLTAARMQLSSAFFFFRSDEARNSAKHLVATLAYEMTQQMPYTLEPVCTAIASNPLIFSSSLTLERQISTTLLRPLTTPEPSRLRVHKLIIVDGLDECLNTNTQQTIIRSFILALLSVGAEIIPHKILIVSRPESHITSAFSAADISPHVERLSLGEWDTKDDIETFLYEKLEEIRQTHPLKHYLPDKWPDNYSMWRLRRQSIGSFAYASVVIRHLASHSDSPECALQDLLSVQPRRAAAAFADLDALYQHILLALDPEVRFTLQKVLCLYVFAWCEATNDLALFLSEDPLTIEIALIHVSSLIQIYDHGQFIKFYHSSFEEFLLDKARSNDLFLYSPNVASAAATALSRVWLHPTDDSYRYFSSISPDSLIGFGQDLRLDGMYFYIAHALVATKLPTSFCYDTPRSHDPDDARPAEGVVDFCVFLQWKSQGNAEPEHIFIYNKAFNVICDWLRSLCYRFFNGAPTAKAIFDTLLDESQRLLYPFMDILCHLILHTTDKGQPFYCLHRVFPEMDHLEIYSAILDRFLIAISRRDVDLLTKSKDEHDIIRSYYFQACRGVKLSTFSHKLEEFVLEGMKALALDSIIDVSPLRCIVRFFYGYDDFTIIKSAIGEKTVLEIRHSIWYIDSSILAGQTDQYISKAHKEHDFPYLTKDVEALYC